MTEPTTPAVPAGWYPDPAGSTQQRWWDGTKWTDHLQAPYTPATEPYQAAGALRAPEGTSGTTVWIWLIVGLIGVGILPSLFIDYGEVVRNSLDSTSGLPTITPGETLSYLVSFLSIALWVLFAALDYRELSRRGILKPFHWAWMFFALITPLVYLIGRSVVVRRRTGSGLAPMWVGIGLTVLAFIIGLALVIPPTMEIINEIASDPSLYY